MTNPVIARPHFLSPFPKGGIPPAYQEWKVIDLAFERRNHSLLRPARIVDLYQAWKSGKLELNPVQDTKFILEVPIEHKGHSYFYYYPIDLGYLFSPDWRQDNLSSPFGFFRWGIEMDLALRVKNYGLTAIAFHNSSFACPLSSAP